MMEGHTDTKYYKKNGVDGFLRSINFLSICAGEYMTIGLFFIIRGIAQILHN
jgi:hypothetical protein